MSVKGGLVGGQTRGMLSEVRGSTPPRGVCITHWFMQTAKIQHCTVLFNLVTAYRIKELILSISGYCYKTVAKCCSRIK